MAHELVVGDRVIVDCPYCGATQLVTHDTSRVECRICGRPKLFATCPKCRGTASLNADVAISPVVKCGRCRKSTARVRWLPGAAVDNSDAASLPLQIYGDGLQAAFLNPDRRGFAGLTLSHGADLDLATLQHITIIFDEASIRFVANESFNSLDSSNLRSLHMASPAQFSLTGGSGWIEGGYGPQGPAEGTVPANSVSGTVVSLTWDSGHLTIFHPLFDPEEFCVILKPVLARLQGITLSEDARQEAIPAGTGPRQRDPLSLLKPTERALADQHIRRGEAVHFVIVGADSQALVALEERLMIIKAGFLAGSLGGGRVTSFRYQDVSGIQINTGFITASLEVLSPGMGATKGSDFWSTGSKEDPFKLPNCLPLAKASIPALKPYFDLLDGYISRARTAPASSGSLPESRLGDLAGQLTQLKQLLDAGALTPDEFEQAKAKLLRT